MKKVLLLTLFAVSALFVNSQNFATGFDTVEDQNAWTEYRMLGESSANWGFGQGQSVSAPYSLSHDYPMGGDVEDWLVSPGLYFSQTNSSFSLSSYKIALSTPPDVYYGIWVSYGSPDPADGDYLELADLSNFPNIDSQWSDTTIDFTTAGDSCYFAIKYAALDFYWLMIWLDDIIIENATLLSNESITINNSSKDILYPNPADDFIYLNLSENSAIEIVNISGQVISSGNYSRNNSRVYISNLTPGIYFITTKEEDSTTTYKFIKE